MKKNKGKPKKTREKKIKPKKIQKQTKNNKTGVPRGYNAQQWNLCPQVIPIRNQYGRHIALADMEGALA